MAEQRDLTADLAICAAATAGPWEFSVAEYHDMGRIKTDLDVVCDFGDSTMYDQSAGDPPNAANLTFIIEARAGWPEAIKRALAAESEVERLRQQIADRDDYEREMGYHGTWTADE